MPESDKDRKSQANAAPVLRRGWTTGACATAAAKAAVTALFGGAFPDPVSIRLPRGGEVSFSLVEQLLNQDKAFAAIQKDAGDDPDITHGCLVGTQIARGPQIGVRFHAGEGVGHITKPGLRLAPGEAAINPVPRRMIEAVLEEASASFGVPVAYDVTISIPGGEDLAKKTLNPRLGIVGGLSILGTTGIVVPYSCASWIHSIHRGIDVARAMGRSHLAATVGSTSEAFIADHYSLPPDALIDMGDFIGGTLKYLKRHPVDRLTIAGGIGKLVKLAQGALDLHSSRSALDRSRLQERLGGPAAFREAIADANTALEVLEHSNKHAVPFGDVVAVDARKVALDVIGDHVAIEVIVIDRQRNIAGHAKGW